MHGSTGRAIQPTAAVTHCSAPRPALGTKYRYPNSAPLSLQQLPPQGGGKKKKRSKPAYPQQTNFFFWRATPAAPWYTPATTRTSPPAGEEPHPPPCAASPLPQSLVARATFWERRIHGPEFFPTCPAYTLREPSRDPPSLVPLSSSPLDHPHSLLYTSLFLFCISPSPELLRCCAVLRLP